VATEYDVVVVGAGMVGGTLAALLGRAGFAVALIETNEPPVFDSSQEVDLRVSALSPGSQLILDQAGAWRAISRSRHNPYRQMHVEGESPDEVLEFDAQSFGMEALGYLVENPLTVASLWQSLEAAGMVELYCPDKLAVLVRADDHVEIELDSGIKLRTRLVAAADGANSRLRSLCGIEQDYWQYNQRGLVAVISTEESNDDTAWQRFLETGPLALLPLANGQSSIVWTLPDELAKYWQQADEAEFLETLSRESRQAFGAVTATSKRASFPLSMRLSEQYVDQGVVLLGDAAHVVHPLAGQGVNLGLLDAAALTEVLADARKNNRSIRSAATLRRYERWRRSEDTLMAKGFDAIRSLYSLPSGPLQSARKLGVSLVQSSWFAREQFLKRAAGQHSDAPRLARGTTIRELVA
jgi:2-octaprenyl-3-methyl-6-methoxy-1,4-benzoquinol hydroxylase/2-octaprenylphenol hydroxylase